VSAVFGLPLVIDGHSVHALVVGGGTVATRKIIALATAGAAVRVRAPRVSGELVNRASIDEKILIERSAYDQEAIGDATLVIAATDDSALNARVAADAKSLRRLVLVVDNPEMGSCVMPAVHRAGDLLVAVTSGGVPDASKRVRDELSRRFDNRYAAAIRQLSRLRERLLASDDRAGWHSAARALLAEDFCDSVESGAFEQRLATWL
jgi:siroheme synthase-like protein